MSTTTNNPKSTNRNTNRKGGKTTMSALQEAIVNKAKGRGKKAEAAATKEGEIPPIVTTPPVEQEAAEEKAPAGLEATPAYVALVLSHVPADKAAAEALTNSAKALARADEQNAIQQGLLVLAMRHDTRPPEEQEERKGTQARATWNGFGKAGYASEAEWGMETGLVTQSGFDAEGSPRYSRRKLTSCVALAMMHLALVNAGVEVGASALDPISMNLLARLGQRVVKEAVPQIAGAVGAGGTVEQLGKLVKKIADKAATEAAAKTEARLKVRVSSIPTDKLLAEVERKLTGIRDAFMKAGGMDDRCGGVAKKMDSLLKRPDLPATQKKQIEAYWQKVADAMLAACKTFGIDVG